MTLKSIYASQSDIPEQYRDIGLYEERGGQWQLVKIDGIKTDADVQRVQRALQDERTQHSELKTRWNALVGDGDPTELRTLLDSIPELKARAAAADGSEDKINELVAAKLATTVAPVQRERDQLAEKLATATKTITGYEQRERTRTIHDAVRTAAIESKMVPTAVEDALMLAERVFDVDDTGAVITRDQVGCTPGLKPADWLSEIQDKRRHWWPNSTGGGAGGSGSGSGFSNNPWSKEHWNLTAQGNVIRTKGREEAERMAKSAGVQIGATRPAG